MSNGNTYAAGRREWVQGVVGEMAIRGLPLTTDQRAVILAWIEDGPIPLLTPDQAAERDRVFTGTGGITTFCDPPPEGATDADRIRFPRGGIRYGDVPAGMAPTDFDNFQFFTTEGPVTYTDHTAVNEAGAACLVQTEPAGAECPHPPGRCRECRSIVMAEYAEQVRQANGGVGFEDAVITRPARQHRTMAAKDCPNRYCTDDSHYEDVELPSYPRPTMPYDAPTSCTCGVPEAPGVHHRPAGKPCFHHDDGGALVARSAYQPPANTAILATDDDDPDASVVYTAPSASVQQLQDLLGAVAAQAHQSPVSTLGTIQELAWQQFTAAAGQQERILWRRRAELGDEEFCRRNGLDIAKLPLWHDAPTDIQDELAAIYAARMDKLHATVDEAMSAQPTTTEGKHHEH